VHGKLLKEGKKVSLGRGREISTKLEADTVEISVIFLILDQENILKRFSWLGKRCRARGNSCFSLLSMVGPTNHKESVNRHKIFEVGAAMLFRRGNKKGTTRNQKGRKKQVQLKLIGLTSRTSSLQSSWGNERSWLV